MSATSTRPSQANKTRKRVSSADLARHCMDYYQCPIEALRRELQRRACASYGSRDQLSERLQVDDDIRGSEATTVATEHTTAFVPREVNLKWTVEFGQTAPAIPIVNQKIVYWNLNTFFPTLQLFFESGLSCTIDGSQLSNAILGLDPRLRSRLTDCTHEEQGRVTKGIVPEKFARSGSSMRILEATVAQRTSVALKPTVSTGQSLMSKAQCLDIIHEVHTVVGLRLNGMSETGYIWAKAEMPSRVIEERVWGDVRLAGLRNDIPAHFLGLSADFTKSGGELKVVEKGSMIKQPAATAGSLNKLARPWI